MSIWFFVAVYVSSSSRGTNGGEDELKETDEDSSVMRPYEDHFGAKKCKHPARKSVSDILLAINFNHPHYSNIPILLDLYRHVFPHYVICGPVKDPKYKIIIVEHPVMQRGFYGYQCLALAIKKRPGFAGYLYVNDDMIINWWTMLDLDKTKIWTGSKVSLAKGVQIGTTAKSKWWKRAHTARRCTEAFNDIENDGQSAPLIQQFYKNTDNERICVNGWSDIFYIPYVHSELFAKLSTIFYDHLVFLEAAVQTIMLFLDDTQKVVLLNGLYLPDKVGYGVDYTNPSVAWQMYSNDLTFIHPYKLDGDNTTKNKDLFRELIVDVSDNIVKTSCLDIVTTEQTKKKVTSKFNWEKVLGKVDWSGFG